MNGSAELAIDPEAVDVDAFPDGLDAGSTVLIASAGDPSRLAVDLRLLCQSGSDDDIAFVVTTTESAAETVATSDRLCSPTERPQLGFVDTTTEQQSVSALYGDRPTVFTPNPGDLERLVLALSELYGHLSSTNGTRHLVVRSLTPILEVTPTARVETILERIAGLRTGRGFTLLGLDFTAHDQETMATLSEHVDGVLWVTSSASDRLTFDYQPVGGRRHRSVVGDVADD